MAKVFVCKLTSNKHCRLVKKLRSNWNWKLDPGLCLRVRWEQPPTSEIPQFQWWILCKKMWKWNYEIHIPFMIHDSKTQNHIKSPYSRYVCDLFKNKSSSFSKWSGKTILLSHESLKYFGAEFIPCLKSCPHRVKWSAWCLKSFPHLNKHESGKDVEKNYHQIWTYCITILYLMSNVILIYHYM